MARRAKNGFRTPATCHPDRPLKGRGLCSICYKTALYWENPKKAAALAKKSRDKNIVAIKLRRQDAHRRKTYGITLAEFEAAAAARNNRCDICNLDRGRTLHIDHDHKTGENRGLLCNSCNRALGWFDHHTEQVLTYLGIKDAKAKENPPRNP